jgi:hypothetical protein
MSHVIRCKDLGLKNLEALKKAAEDLGGKLVEANTYRWYGRYMRDSPLPEGIKEEDLGRCNYKITFPDMPNAYEIGVLQHGNELELLYDYWAGGYGMCARVGLNNSEPKLGPQKLLELYHLRDKEMLLSKKMSALGLKSSGLQTSKNGRTYLRLQRMS